MAQDQEETLIISKANFDRLTRNNKAYIDLKHQIEEIYWNEENDDETNYIQIAEKVLKHFGH